MHSRSRSVKVIESVVKNVPGVSSALAERLTGGRYIDIDVDRAAAARYGLSVADVQAIVATAIGGENVGEVVSGRERFPIKFYLVCMIFILLDVDAAFLYPWALVFRELGLFGLVEMGVFMLLLGGGFTYAWKVGALDW